MSLSASSSKINDQLKIQGLPFSAMIWHQFRRLLSPKSSTHYQPANADPWPDTYPLCVTAMSVAKEVGNKRDKCLFAEPSPVNCASYCKRLARNCNRRHRASTCSRELHFETSPQVKKRWKLRVRVIHGLDRSNIKRKVVISENFPKRETILVRSF